MSLQIDTREFSRQLAVYERELKKQKGIVIGGDLSSTVNFFKLAVIDGDSVKIPMSGITTDGPNQINLTPSETVETLALQGHVQMIDYLHSKRRAARDEAVKAAKETESK